MKNEPVLTYTGIGTVISTTIMLGLAMAVSLGWIRLEPEQMTAIEKFIGALIGLIIMIVPPMTGAWLARNKVTPTQPDTQLDE
jgi:hypothetical protein